VTTPSQIVAASCIQLILRARTTVPVSDQLKKKVPGFWGSLAITRVQRRLPTLGVGPPRTSKFSCHLQIPFVYGLQKLQRTTQYAFIKASSI
jgi:hypothetical protein